MGRKLTVQPKLITMHNKRVWEQISANMVASGYIKSTRQYQIKINNLKCPYDQIFDSPHSKYL